MNYELSTQHFKVNLGFTLIELLIARHPKLIESETLRVERPWRRKAPLGFTLIELLVVITILGILVSVAFYSFENARQKGRDSRRIQDLTAVKSALVLYYQDNKKFPQATVGNYVLDSLNTDLTPTYIEKTPQDPLQSSTSSGNCDNKSNIYCYQLNGDGTFILWAQLENSKNPQIYNKPSATCKIVPPTNTKLNYCLSGPSL